LAVFVVVGEFVRAHGAVYQVGDLKFRPRRGGPCLAASLHTIAP
jgi:hypothetical protein